jgi:ascorbate PTS system EIIA or EIIAB component
MAELGPVTTGASVRIRVGDWRAAVRAACQPLVDAGAVEPRYADRCVEMVEEHGPYVVIAPGLALAHARPEDGVSRLSLAVATLAQPVPFGHPDNDPVDLVLAFGSPDDQQHVGMLSALARRLMAGLDAKLRAAGTDAEARALLEGDSDAG